MEGVLSGTASLTGWVVATLLASLRIAPLFAFAPPFSLVRLPVSFRVALGVGLAACLVSTTSAAAALNALDPGALVLAAVRELLLGTVFVLACQITFGALYLAGRTIDIQAGFGLALLIDPTSRAQTPLVGTLFAYAAGAIFFAMDGHLELLRVMAGSLQAVPIGSYRLPDSIAPLLAFMSMAFLAAFGVAGGTILILFLVDLAIAMLSRTVPQMNVLVLGFQVKTLVLLLVLPTSFGVAGALLARMMRMMVSAMPRLI